MASTNAIKGRIKAVKSTKQITKAMELVSASKMRRSQESAIRSRAYRDLANQILARLRQLTDVTKHPLYKVRPVKNRLHLIITSDRTLAGAYNSNVIRQFADELKKDAKEGVTSHVILIGKQGSRFIARVKDVEVIGAYHNFPEHPTANDIRPLLRTIIDKFLAGEIDAADVLYTDYKSSIAQIVTYQRLLPAAFSEEYTEAPTDLDLALFEPSPQEVLDNVTERLVEALLTQAILESLASEHSMRMIAMKNATDNANDLIDDLTLQFNGARQAAITQELAEITGGAEAIK